MLDAEINRQALMIAYIDDFYLMMIVSLLAIPLLLLLRKGRSRRPASPRRRWTDVGESARTARSAVRRDPLLDHRRDPGAPFAAVEDAVMADALGEVILLHRRRQAGRDVERGLGLADAGNIVALALDREQGDVA